jgi:hypothetical protein
VKKIIVSSAEKIAKGGNTTNEKIQPEFAEKEPGKYRLLQRVGSEYDRSRWKQVDQTR